MDLQQQLQQTQGQSNQGEQKPPEPKAQEQKPVEQPQDLVSRVAKFGKESNQPAKQNPSDEIHFDRKELDNIKSAEEAKTWADKAYKSMEKGYQEKYQALAEKRKELEQRLNEQTSWTPQRIQQLLQDPNFVQAAQVVMQTSDGNTAGSEDWESLDDASKAKLKALETEIMSLKQQNQQTLLHQQDAELSNRYANYDGRAVDSLVQDLSTNRTQATREHLWKVLDYESAVERAYKMGREDERGFKQEKFNAPTGIGNGVNMQHVEKFEPNAKKLGQDFFINLYKHTAGKLREGQMQQ